MRDVQRKLDFSGCGPGAASSSSQTTGGNKNRTVFDDELSHFSDAQGSKHMDQPNSFQAMIDQIDDLDLPRFEDIKKAREKQQPKASKYFR